MELLQIYFLTLAALIVTLILYRIIRYIPLILLNRRSCLGDRSIRHIFLMYFAYPRLPWRFMGLDYLSPVHISFILAYFGVTGFFNLFGVHTFAEAGTRAAYLSLINLFPLYFSGGREFGAHLVGTALKTYALIHRLTGIMAVLQAVIHVTIICRSTTLRLSDKSHFYGFLVFRCVPILFPLLTR